MLLSLLPLASPCGEDTATGGTTQCYKAKLKGMCAEKNSWVRSRCSATCCGIARRVVHGLELCADRAARLPVDNEHGGQQGVETEREREDGGRRA